MNVNERILKALANRRRLTIVSYLKRHRRSTVGNLADMLKVSLPTASKHLAILAGADIVDNEHLSLLVYYRLSDSLPALARSILSHL